jgi:predicted nuclease with TOPRIM domain
MSEKIVSKDEYDTALAKISTLETENKQLKDQLGEATDAFKAMKSKFDAAEAQEKGALIAKLVKENPGLEKDALGKLALKDLYQISEAVAKAQPKSFVSIMRQADVDKSNRAPLGTIGSFNQDTGKFEEGL